MYREQTNIQTLVLAVAADFSYCDNLLFTHLRLLHAVFRWREYNQCGHGVTVYSYLTAAWAYKTEAIFIEIGGVLALAIDSTWLTNDDTQQYS